MEVVIRKGRLIEFPEILMEKFRLKVGDKIILKEHDNDLLIVPKRTIVDELRGSIKVENKNKIDEIISTEVWELNEA
ncbi:MAG: hypothetical protein WA102_06505 [Candidatus Methanoperedens sp.]|nr:hypothetical protein [Candidatus Methanoperedens sp.]